MKDVDRIRIRKVYTSCPGWPSGGSKELSSQTQIYAIPCRLQLPTNKWRSAGPGRSLYLLSITGLAALGGQYHSLSGTEFSASKRVTCLLPATQAESHAGSKVYIWNVFARYTLPISSLPLCCTLWDSLTERADKNTQMPPLPHPPSPHLGIQSVDKFTFIHVEHHWPGRNHWESVRTVHCKKELAIFPPQPGCHWSNSLRAGKN